MRREEFFKKFELFADLPDAVAKMRELILNLAVCGKLVPQEAGEDAAEKMLNRIKAEIEAGVRANRLRARREVEFERPIGELPQGWSWTPLSSLVAAQDGAICDGPFGSKLKTEHYTVEKGYAVVRLGNIGVGRFIWGKEGHISRAHFESLSSNHLLPGDLLVAGLADPLLRCCEVPSSLGPAVNKADCFRVRLHHLVERRYVQHYLNSRLAKRFAATENHGMTRERINLSGTKSLPVPVPPSAEQKRIVAKVDELMELCDQLEAQQKERETRHAALARASLSRFADAPTPANLTFLFRESYSVHAPDLRESILALAIQGRLVKQEVTDEPPTMTFPRLAAASLGGDHESFPAGWLSVPLLDTGNWRGGGTPSKSRLDFWHGDLPWVSPKDMKVLHISDAQDHISASAVEGSSVRLIPQGSLLMVVRGLILARAFPVALTTREITINQDMKALTPHYPATKHFLLLALRAFATRVLELVERSSHGTCKLKTEVLERLDIPIPPLAEQRRIVAKVDQLMALVDALETQLAASHAAGARLLEAVLDELTNVRGTPDQISRVS